jgi:hypothetical protein
MKTEEKKRTEQSSPIDQPLCIAAFPESPSSYNKRYQQQQKGATGCWCLTRVECSRVEHNGSIAT